MEEKREAEQVQEPKFQEKSKRHFWQLLVVFIILAGLIFFGAKIYLDNRTVQIKTSLVPAPASVVASPTSILSPTLTPTLAAATKTPTPTTKPSNQISFGFKKGLFYPYTITIANGWTTQKANDETGRKRLNITKGNYMLSLDEDTSGASGQCNYPGETPTPGASVETTFVTINAGPLELRRGTNDTTQKTVYYSVCQKQITGFAYPTQFGYILYTTPQTGDSATLAQMDAMVASLRTNQ
jgi:hypothetical protein